VLELSEAKVVGGIAVVETDDGKFTLEGICEEGGQRLVKYTGKKSININPNPVDISCKIDYFVIEKGLVEISVYNIYGDKIKTIDKQHRTPGRYQTEFVATNMPGGTYFITMQTPGDFVSKILNVVR
jgi:hypothetical protein